MAISKAVLGGGFSIEPSPLEQEIKTAKHGTLCGHMRFEKAEGKGIWNTRRCEKDRKVLEGMEREFQISPDRYSSYYFAGAADCTPCLQQMAPHLYASIKQLIPAKRRWDGNILKKKKRFDHADAVGALADLRALAWCSKIILDDAAPCFGGSYAAAIAASGNFTPCVEKVGKVGLIRMVG